MTPGAIGESALRSICERYEIDQQAVSFVGGMENSVYSFQKDGQEYFLRIGHSQHMTFDLVKAEIDWVLYLADNDVPAVKPVQSVNGEYVERITRNSHYYNVVAFEKAEGANLDFYNPQSWPNSAIRSWGKTVGRMQAVTKGYTPKSTRRYKFNLTPNYIRSLIPKETSETIEKVIHIFKRLDSLPTTKDGYGLVHSDLHVGNFFVKNSQVSAVLDFDRACYKWFISEIAIALYYPLYITSLRHNEEDQRKFANQFLPIFWQGYETENQLDDSWIQHLDLFIQVRDAVLFLYLPSDAKEETKDLFRRRIISKEPYTLIKWDEMV